MNPLLYAKLGGAALLLAAAFYLGGLASKSRYEALRAAQLSAVAAAYQNQVLAREASEAKLQRVQNAYDAIKDLPDPATVGTAHRVLIAAAGGCDVPETRAMAGGAQTPAAQPVGPSGIERALGDYIAACSADAAQMIPMVELAP